MAWRKQWENVAQLVISESRYGTSVSEVRGAGEGTGTDTDTGDGMDMAVGVGGDEGADGETDGAEDNADDADEDDALPLERVSGAVVLAWAGPITCCS